MSDKVFMCGDDDYQHEVKGKVIAETNKAFKIRADDREEWFPKSQIDWELSGDVFNVGERVMTFYIPQWLMEKKGWA